MRSGMDERPFSLAPPLRLTDAEREVLRELTQREASAVAPKVSASYTRLLELARSENAVDTVLAAHLTREILAALPGALGMQLTHEHLQYRQRLDALSEAWPADVRVDPPNGQALIELRRLVEEHEQASVRAGEGARALLQQSDRARAGFVPDPSIDRWTNLSARGSGLAHRIRNRDRQFPTADETRRLVDELTAVLLAAVAPYFESIREVDRLLALQQPTDTDAQRVAALLATQSQYAYFFERAGETWLRPLANVRGLLVSPPRLLDVGGGYVQAPGWPQGVFLKRVAATEPHLVSHLAKGTLSTDNPRAIALVVEIANALPPASAAGLVHPISRALATPLAVEYASREAGSLAKRLADAGFAREAANLLLAVVRPALSSPRDLAWHIEQVLGGPLEVVARTGGEVVPGLRSCLRQLARRDRGVQRYPTLWLRNIDARPRYGVNLAWLLANALYRSLVLAPLDVARVHTDELLADRHRVFARIALAAIADRPDLLESGDALLGDPGRWDNGKATRHEYRRALGVLWACSSPAARDALLEYAARAEGASIVAEGWHIEFDPEEVRRGWRSALLYKIHEELPSEWVSSHGPLEAIDDDLLPEPTAEWVGPTSPFTEEDLARAEPGAVLERARTWQPPHPSGFPSPSLEGLGRVLAAVVLRRLPEFEGLHTEFARLPSVVLAQLTSTIERALRKGDIEDRVHGVSFLLAIGHELRGEDNREDWDHEVKRNVAGTITFAANENLLDESAMHAAAELVTRLLSDADPSPASEQRDASNGYDVGMLALNSIRGEAATAGIELLLAARRASRESEVEDLSASLRTAVSRDVSRSVRAAVGLRLPWLLARDAAHQAEWLELLFGPDVPNPARDATWSAYLLYSRFYRDIAVVLAPQYQLAVAALVARPEEHHGRPRDDDEALGIHVALAHILGLSPELEGQWLHEFYARAAGWTRARVTRWIAEQAADAQVPEDARASARAFLEERARSATPDADLDELKAISWISADAGADRDVLDRILLPALEKTGGATENGQGAAGFASRIAPTMPHGAARVVQLLVAGDEWKALPHIAATELRATLDQVMRSEDPEARAIAIDVINTLGAQGFLEFRDLLP